MSIKLFKPDNNSFSVFNKTGIAIKDIKRVCNTNAILVTYIDNSKVIYQNYKQFVDNHNRKEIFNAKIFSTLEDCVEEYLSNVNENELIIYNGEIYELNSDFFKKFNIGIDVNRLDIFNDGSCISCYTFNTNTSNLNPNMPEIVVKNKSNNIIGPELIPGKFSNGLHMPPNIYGGTLENFTYGNENNEYTLSVWIKVLSGFKFNITLDNKDEEDEYLRVTATITENKRDLKIQSKRNGNNWVTEVQIPDTDFSQYRHLVFGVNSDGVFCYLDGKLIGTSEFKPNYNTGHLLLNVGYTSYLQNGGDDYSVDADVVYDQLRIFNKALTEEEIQKLYNIGFLNTLDIFNDGSCIACYTFNDTANNLGNQYNGIVNNIEYVDGKFGKAIKISNANLEDNTVQFDSNIPEEFVDEYSVSFWFKQLSSYSNRANVSMIATTKDTITNNDWKHRWSFDINPKDLYIKHFDVLIDYDNKVIYNLANNEPIELNKWYFVAFSYKNGDSFYGLVKDEDGNIILENTINNPSGKIKTGFALGRTGDYYNDHLIDQARIFNRALTVDEIEKLYNQISTDFKVQKIII